MQLNTHFLNTVFKTEVETVFTAIGFSTDSRNIKPGEVFFALSGPNFDGHDYIGQVKNSGAIAAVVSRKLDIDLPQFVVASPLQALADLASAWRETFSIPLLGITGTNGKTTTKEMIASILEAYFGKACVLKTEGNLNNHIGVPLTLLKLTKKHKIGILEMGMSGPGEISFLCNVAKPSITGITNAGPGHLQGLKDIDGVAKEKGCIISACAQGTTIINKDDPYSIYWSSLAKDRKLYFSLRDKDADVYAAAIQIHPKDWLTRFNLHYKEETIPIELPLLGKHNVANALCATAMCFAAGVNIKAVIQGLKNMSAVKGRLKKKIINDNITVIDDTYNANPASFYAAIAVLESLPATRKILVLADMRELGEGSDNFHIQAGKDLNNKLHWLFTLGDCCRKTHLAYQGNKQHFDSANAMTEYLKNFIEPGDTLLFKGSRSMQLDKIIEKL